MGSLGRGHLLPRAGLQTPTDAHRRPRTPSSATPDPFRPSSFLPRRWTAPVKILLPPAGVRAAPAKIFLPPVDVDGTSEPPDGNSSRGHLPRPRTPLPCMALRTFPEATSRADKSLRCGEDPQTPHAASPGLPWPPSSLADVDTGPPEWIPDEIPATSRGITPVLPRIRLPCGRLLHSGRPPADIPPVLAGRGGRHQAGRTPREGRGGEDGTRGGRTEGWTEGRRSHGLGADESWLGRAWRKSCWRGAWGAKELRPGRVIEGGGVRGGGGGKDEQRRRRGGGRGGAAGRMGRRGGAAGRMGHGEAKGEETSRGGGGVRRRNGGACGDGETSRGGGGGRGSML